MYKRRKECKLLRTEKLYLIVLLQDRIFKSDSYIQLKNISIQQRYSNDYSELSDGCGATGSVTVIFTVFDQCGNTSSTQAKLFIIACIIFIRISSYLITPILA